MVRLANLVERCFDETSAKWLSESYQQAFPEGFMPLFGPAIERPDVFIVSENPGAHSHVLASEISPSQPPPALTYLQKKSDFAKRLMEVLPGKHTKAMASCRMFFRTSSVDQTNEIRRQHRAVVKDAEDFSQLWLRKLLEASRPKMVLFVGKPNNSFLTKKWPKFELGGVAQGWHDNRNFVAIPHTSKRNVGKYWTDKLTARTKIELKSLFEGLPQPEPKDEER